MVKHRAKQKLQEGLLRRDGFESSSRGQDNKCCSKVKKRNLSIASGLDSGFWKQRSCALHVLMVVHCGEET